MKKKIIYSFIVTVVSLLSLNILAVVSSNGNHFIGEWEALYRQMDRVNVDIKRSEQEGKFLVHLEEDGVEVHVEMTLGEGGCLEYILDEEDSPFLTDNLRLCLNDSASGLILYQGAVKAIENGGKQFVGRWHDEDDYYGMSLVIEQGSGKEFVLQMQEEGEQVSVVVSLENDSCLYYEAAEETTTTSFDKHLQLCLIEDADLLKVRAGYHRNYNFVRVD